MATPFDRAAKRYITEWVPRFTPYHLDLVRELSLVEGQRVSVQRCGPGAEVLAVARAVGPSGRVRATDPSGELIAICDEQAKKAGFEQIVCEKAEIDDVGGGGWNAIVCAFGMWTSKDRPALIRKWSSALVPNGKVGVLTFGPPDPSDPFEILAAALRDLEPDAVAKPPRIDATRDAIAKTFEDGGLALVRHTTLRHAITFPTAEAFIEAIREGRTWRSVWEEVGEERMGLVCARFYDHFGGPTAPLTFEPVATLAIAAPPGAEVDIAARPSVVAPKIPSVPPDEPSKA